MLRSRSSPSSTGSVSRAPHDLRRLVRRRELTRIGHGVFLDHTGEPAWEQRAWAGVLALWPAALCGTSALRAYEGTETRRAEVPLLIAVGEERRVVPPRGVKIRAMVDLDARTQWNLSPPRLRIEHALVDVIAALGPGTAAVGELTGALGARRTTVARLRAVVGDRSRLPHRAWITSLLSDLETGVSSVLEHAYLTRVERPHGLHNRGSDQPDALARRTPVRADVLCWERLTRGFVPPGDPDAPVSPAGPRSGRPPRPRPAARRSRTRPGRRPGGRCGCAVRRSR